MGPGHLIDNLENGRIKISDFRNCNDIFELASFSMRNPRVRKDHRIWKESICKEIGLICLSESWRHPLMWAHYAKSGSGACLVLKIRRDLVKEVRYISKRRARGEDFFFPPIDDLHGIKEICSEKFSAWSYESEWRMFCDLSSNDVATSDGIHYWTFSENCQLIGVINGPRPCIGRGQILTAIRGRGANEAAVNYFQTRAAFHEFEVVSQQNQKYWKS